MSKEKKYKWIIAVHDAYESNTRLMKMKATKKKMKKQLLDLIKSDRETMRTKFQYYDWTPEPIDHIEERFDEKSGKVKELYADIHYQDCHIEYRAIVCKIMETLH